MSATGIVVGVLAGGAVASAAVRPRLPRRLAELQAVRREGGDRARHPVGVGDLRADPRALVLSVVLVGGCWLLHPLLAVAVAVSVTLVEPVQAERAARRRSAEVRTALPDVIDLFRCSVDAGLTVGGAVDAVSPRVDGAWRDALADVRRQVALGERQAVALRALDQLGDAARPLTRALVASERDGAPLVVALDALARDARLDRRREAEERARRLPVQLLFPLVLCILPAFGLLTVVPLLAGTVQSLTG